MRAGIAQVPSSTRVEELDRTGYRSRLAAASFFLEDVTQLTPKEQAALVEWFDRQGAVASPERVPLRLIAAADARLYEWVQRGAFREDLFYRLNAIHIVVPE
jgi:DNA-binding NtrC family response regulator